MNSASTDAKAAPPRRFLQKAITAAAALLLTSCATTQMDFSSWAVSYNNSVESATNRMMLLNIMRASEDMPLMFTGMMVVRGQGTAGASVGVGAGIAKTAGQTGGVFGDSTTKNWGLPSAGLQVGTGFNFDVVVLDSAEFYNGLMNPIGIDALHALSKRGVPPELILYLMLDRVRITVGGQSQLYVNEPSDPNYESFRKMLTQLISYGLTTELDTVTVPISPLLTEAEVKGNMGAIFQAAQAGITPVPEGSGFRLVKRSSSARLCFMALGPSVPELLPQSALCKDSPKRRAATTSSAGPQGGIQTLGLPDAQMEVQTRSTRDIFGFLGRLARGQTDAGREGINLDLTGVPAYQAAGRSKALFKVVKNNTRGDDLVGVDYRGATYSLANEGYTSTVLAVLQQFFNLSKSIHSVPNVGTVVVR